MNAILFRHEFEEDGGAVLQGGRVDGDVRFPILFCRRELLMTFTVEAQCEQFETIGGMGQLKLQLSATEQGGGAACTNVGAAVRRKCHVIVDNGGGIDDDHAFGNRKRLIVN